MDPPGSDGTIDVTGINNAGEIVGWYEESNGSQSFSYSNGAYTLLSGPAGAQETQIVGINNAGQIIGVYENSAKTLEGFVYSEGHYTTLIGIPAGINDLGDIVGKIPSDLGATGFLATPM